ncbi:hypothetical protein [uncultured Tateyamaria sp.]|uniref:hypothetical protein n=1 Tax=uncultured Tateyamaria sp. TaxID=455651 RepID=UPI00260FF3FF|nr:hypothetical protein [uncultured Tateyamaria sp.]
MTSPRLILHVGDRKTGTTTIQHVLDARARNPEAYGGTFGVHYPLAGRNIEQRITHVNLAHELLEDKRFTPDLGGWADLSEELHSAQPPLTVISSEGFESVAPGVVAQALDTYIPKGTEITLVAYIRPHADRIVASYAQNVKTGKYVLPLDTFARRSMRGRLGALHKRAAAWKSVFGDRYHVRPYARDLLMDRDVVADFLVGQVGLDTAVMQNLPPIPDENPTPGVRVLELIRQLTQTMTKGGTDLPPGADQRMLAPLRATLMGMYPDDPKLRLTPDLATACRDACMDDAQAMDRDFCEGTAIFEGALHRAVDNAPLAADPNALPPREEALHDAYATALATLLRVRVDPT